MWGNELAVSVARGPVRWFPNTEAGITAGLAWVQGQAVTQVVCEATGGYERLVVQRVRETDDLTVAVAHPTKVRAFARAVGQGAKTDPLDAQLLAHYGEVFDLPVEAAQEEASAEVRALLGRRQQLLDQRTQERNRLEKGLQGRVKQSCQRHLAWLDKELKRLEEEYQQAIQPARSWPNVRPCIRVCGGSGSSPRPLCWRCPGSGAGVGQGVDGLGRRGPVGRGQWDAPGLSGDSRRPGAGAAGALYGRLVSDPHEHGLRPVLSALTAAGEAGQSGARGGDAEVAVAAACGSAAGNPLGSRRGAGGIKKLDLKHRYSRHF